MPKDTLAITEKQFEGQVKELAKLFGYKYYHTWRSIHSPAGFPDVVMVRGDRLIFAELKSDKGQLSNKQKEWLEALGETSAEVYVWRPDDFNFIAEIIR